MKASQHFVIFMRAHRLVVILQQNTHKLSNFLNVSFIGLVLVDKRSSLVLEGHFFVISQLQNTIEGSRYVLEIDFCHLCCQATSPENETDKTVVEGRGFFLVGLAKFSRHIFGRVALSRSSEMF
jgi:hypothetical protein